MSKSNLVVKKSAKSVTSVTSSKKKPSEISQKEEVDLSAAMEEAVSKVVAPKSKKVKKSKKVIDSDEEEEPLSLPKSKNGVKSSPSAGKSFKKQSVKAFVSFDSDDDNSGDEDVLPSKKSSSKKKQEEEESDDEVIVLKSSARRQKKEASESEDDTISPSSRSSSSSRGSSPPSSQRNEVELVSGYGFKKTKKDSIATLDLEEKYPEICDTLNISRSAGRFIMKTEEDLFERIVLSGTSEELIMSTLTKRFGKKLRTRSVPQTSSPSEKGVYLFLMTLASEIRKACDIQLRLVESKLITLWMVSFYYSKTEDTSELEFYSHKVSLTVEEKKSDKRNRPVTISAPDALCYVIGMMITRGASVESMLWYDNLIPVPFTEIMSTFHADPSAITDANYSITVSRKGDFPASVFVMNYDKLGPYMVTIRSYFETLKDMNKMIKFTQVKTGRTMNLAK